MLKEKAEYVRIDSIYAPSICFAKVHSWEEGMIEGTIVFDRGGYWGIWSFKTFMLAKQDIVTPITKDQFDVLYKLAQVP